MVAMHAYLQNRGSQVQVLSPLLREEPAHDDNPSERALVNSEAESALVTDSSPVVTETPAREPWPWALSVAVLVLVELLVIAAWLTFSPPARAHVPDRPCAYVARVTGTTVDACRAARIRHAGVHRAAELAHACGVRTRMPRDLCTALGAAIVADGHPAAWATSRDTDLLIWRESSHNRNAVNPSSEACGWFQRLVARRLSPGRGCPWKVTRLASGRWIVHHPPIEQARNGLRYIAGRYGSPSAALRFHDRNGWY